MLRSEKELKGYRIRAADGEVGKVHDFIVDDERWLVRYLVVDTRSWLPDHKVLLSPLTLGQPDHERRDFPVELTRAEVKDSPPIDVARPVALERRQEGLTFGLLTWGWPDGVGDEKAPMVNVDLKGGPPQEEGKANLRSLNTLRGYSVEAVDGTIGRVDDFIIDDEEWVVRYVAVTWGRIRRRQVLLPADWIRRVQWAIQTVSFDLERDQITSAPSYEPSKPIDREQEREVYDHFGQPRYWE